MLGESGEIEKQRKLDTRMEEMRKEDEAVCRAVSIAGIKTESEMNFLDLLNVIKMTETLKVKPLRIGGNATVPEEVDMAVQIWPREVFVPWLIITVVLWVMMFLLTKGLQDLSRYLHAKRLCSSTSAYHSTTISGPNPEPIYKYAIGDIVFLSRELKGCLDLDYQVITAEDLGPWTILAIRYDWEFGEMLFELDTDGEFNFGDVRRRDLRRLRPSKESKWNRIVVSVKSMISWSRDMVVRWLGNKRTYWRTRARRLLAWTWWMVRGILVLFMAMLGIGALFFAYVS